MTGELLVSLGISAPDARNSVELFKENDVRRLKEDFEHYDDFEKLRANAVHYAAELESLFTRQSIEFSVEEETEA